MNSVLLAGAVQRMIEVAFQAAPTILVGVLVAGVIRHLIGYEQTRRVLDGGLGPSLLKAWLAGMLLPVCSLGVLPVMRELQKAGVRGGTILAFGLTAPLFNPISILYGLTLSDPLTLLIFCLGSLTVVTILGVLWDRLFPVSPQNVATPAQVPHGIRRLTAIANTSVREAAGPLLLYGLVALLGVGVLAMALPHGRLQLAAEVDDPLAPLFMAIIAIPAYAAPMTVMMQLASMFQHGNSIGAAFTLLVLGAGLNAGLLIWLLVQHSPLRTIVALGSLFGLAVAIGYGLDKPLYPNGVEPAGHTHAFDGYCNPFLSGESQPWSRVARNLRDNVQPYESIAGVALLILVIAGIGLRWADRKERIEAWLARPLPQVRRRLDYNLPAPVLGAVALVGLIAASVFGCFLYYPPRDEILKEMKFVHTEVFAAANSGQFETALYWIPIHEDWSRKLIVSEYMRGRPVSRYQQMKAKVFTDRLELLEHEAEDQDFEKCREMVIPLNRSFERLRKAFAAESS